MRLVRSFRRKEHDNRPFSHACMPVMPSHCSNVGPPIIPKSVFNSMHVAIRETFALMLVFNIPSMGARAHIKEPLPRICLRSPHKGRNDRVQKRQNPNHMRHDRDDATPLRHLLRFVARLLHVFARFTSPGCPHICVPIQWCIT